MQSVQLRVLRGTLALLSMLSVSAVHAASITRTSSFEYDPASGLLTKEVIEPDNSNLCLVTVYTRDAFGNVVSGTTRNCNGSIGEAPAPSGDAVIAARTATTGFDSRGQFPTSSSNALNQSETRAYDPGSGGTTSLTGPNGLTTTWSYDGFGRKTLETRADGTRTRYQYVLCAGVEGGTANCPSVGSGAATYYIQVTPLAGDGVTQNGAWSKTYYDLLNRVIRSETQGFAGTSIYTDTQYDSLGRIAQVSRPYYAGATAYWTTNSYDVLSRVASTTQPDGSSLTLSYNGLTVSSTHSPSNHTRSETKNSQGQVVQVKDTQNNILSYRYDPFGNLTQTTDPLGNVSALSYDTRGRKTGMVDRDMGTWTYAYNALGELVRQTDAKAQVVTLRYDKLGRLIQRNELDLNSYWYYDAYFGGAACAKGIGKLCEARADNAYRQVVSYDSLGRTSNVATYIDSAAAPYNVALTYDSNGRVLTRSYPTGFAVKSSYNALGYLSELRRGDSNALLWRVDTLDAEGHLLRQTHGNNVATYQSFEAETGRLLATVAGAGNAVQNMTYAYTSDKLGNLYNRQDGNLAQIETFAYDSLDRLTQWQIQGSGISGILSKTVTYNALGNILSKSDVGTYTYNASGASSLRPHAVASITGTLNGVVNPTFTYDANGNLTAAAGRTLTYTSYNQVRQITQGTTTLTFNFDVQHQRVKEIGPNDTTLFVLAGGVHYEKKTATVGGLVTHQHFIQAYGLMLGVHITKSDATTQTRYFHLDHLGSIRVISDESGAVVERLAYDPWGKRRQANGNDDPNNTITSAVTDRGYTGHEHLDEVGLIHMNGRVYDPLLGRFVSADPFIQNIGDLQSHNRYSYCGNNPLSGTDPSGYIRWRSVLQVVGIVAAIVVAPYATQFVATSLVGTVPGSITWTVAGSVQTFAGASGALGAVSVVGGGAIAGFVGGAIAGGSFAAGLTGAWQGALTAGLFYGAGFAEGVRGSLSKVAAHAAAGCVAAVASSASCGSGALAAGFAEFAGPRLPISDNQVLEAAKSGVLGGTASVLGGGKFANGAMTGAFGYLYNHCGHGGCDGGNDEAALRMQGVPDGDYYNPTITSGDKAVLDATVTLALSPLGVGRGAVQGFAAAGREFEALVGVDSIKTTIQISGRERIPDVLNVATKTLGELKTVSYQAYTSQLRDFAAWAGQNGYQVQLTVRYYTQLSRPLQEAIRNGFINLRRW